MRSWLFKPKPLSFSEKELTVAKSRVLSEIMPICPCCRSSIDRHEYANFAVAVGREDMQALLQLSESREWAKLRAIQSFEGLENAFEAVLISCGEELGVLINLYSPAELFDTHSLLRTYELSPGDRNDLSGLTPPIHWQTIAIEAPNRS